MSQNPRSRRDERENECKRHDRPQTAQQSRYFVSRLDTTMIALTLVLRSDTTQTSRNKGGVAQVCCRCTPTLCQTTIVQFHDQVVHIRIQILSNLTHIPFPQGTDVKCLTQGVHCHLKQNFGQGGDVACSPSAPPCRLCQNILRTNLASTTDRQLVARSCHS